MSNQISIANLQSADAVGGIVTEYVDQISGKRFRVHKFLASSNLVCNRGGYMDVLLIAGGGGSGTGADTWGNGAPGGAGGFLEERLWVPIGVYPVVVGIGGAITTNGGDSIFRSLCAKGGGFGGNSSWDSGTSSPGIAGGSGGGGGATGNPAGQASAPGAGTVGQGYAGGFGSPSNYNGPGGGAGGSPVGATPGIGKTSTITGTPVIYAIGGGSGTPQNANTGNGSNGGNTPGNSGIAFIKYEI